MEWRTLLKILIPLQLATSALNTFLDYDDQRHETISINPEILDTALSILQSKLKLKPPIRPLNLLQHSRKCEASDSRDRVYAFVGLADSHYGIVPDYSPGNTIEMVFADATKIIISYENKLDTLAHTPHRDPLDRWDRGNLPSWVVD
jgi:hypothetical protein